MPKLNDETRMFREIPKDGTAIGNITLRKNLEMDDDTYFKTRKILIDSNKIAIAGGKGGSVFRIVDIAEDKPTKNIDSKYSSEVKIYDDFLNTIRDKYTQDMGYQRFIIQKTAYAGPIRTGGIWTRPDITLIIVQDFPFWGPKYLDVITFEIKHFTDIRISGVFETIAHTKFANKSFLSIYLPDEALEIIGSDDLERIEEECDRFDIGLIFFKDAEDFDSFDFRKEPVRQNTDPEDQNEFILRQINIENQKVLLSNLK